MRLLIFPAVPTTITVSNLIIQSRNDFVQSLRGKGGGYRLIKEPSEYTVGSILRITEGSFAPVSCLEKQPNRCERASYCKTLHMWEGLQKVVEEYFEGITIQDLLDQAQGGDDYII